MASPSISSPTHPNSHVSSNNVASSSSPSKSAAPPLTLSCFPYQLRTKVYFRDCDMYCHVNNATYYHYFDTLFNTFFVEEAGMDPTLGSVVGLTAANSCNYRSDISFPSRLVLALRVLKIGSSSVTAEAAVFKARSPQQPSDTRLVATGSWKNQPNAHQSEIANRPLRDEDWILAATGTYVWVFVQRKLSADQQKWQSMLSFLFSETVHTYLQDAFMLVISSIPVEMWKLVCVSPSFVSGMRPTPIDARMRAVFERAIAKSDSNSLSLSSPALISPPQQKSRL